MLSVVLNFITITYYDISPQEIMNLKVNTQHNAVYILSMKDIYIHIYDRMKLY